MSMTHDRWKQIERLQWEKILKDNPTANRRRLQKKLHEAMVLTHGPCPREPGKPPLKVKLGLWFVRKKLEKMIMDGKKSGIPKWLLAAAFGLTSAYGVFDLAYADGAISLQEGFAIGNAVVVAAIAKFSNPEKKLSHKPSVK